MIFGASQDLDTPLTISSERPYFLCRPRAPMRLDRPPARILMLVVGFVGLRKQGEIQSPRDGRDAILHTSLTADRSVAAGHKRRSTFESPIRNRYGRTRLLEIRRA